jgi:hypothetical protein
MCRRRGEAQPANDLAFFAIALFDPVVQSVSRFFLQMSRTEFTIETVSTDYTTSGGGMYVNLAYPRLIAPRSLSFCRFGLLLFYIVLSFAARPAMASLVADAAADFTIASNPNGAWSYGYSNLPGGAFTPFTANSTAHLGDSDFDGWFPPIAQTSAASHPFLARNEAMTEQQVLGLRLPPGALGLHPGPDASNEYAVIRWTTPSTGLYEISAMFTDRDFTDPSFKRGATTDVHILHNTSSLYSAEVTQNGWGMGPSGYLNVLALSVGDVLDFAVGNGADNTIGADSTGLIATITAVPEPSAFLLFGAIALVTLGAVWWRRPTRALEQSIAS